MSARDCLQAKGTVVEVLTGDAYRVELANGHRAVARAPKGAPRTAFKIGDTVLIEFHPYDLSRGWIIRG